VIILDTCVLIFDALDPKSLSAGALNAIERGENDRELACSDISLWEIAMLVRKKRLDPGIDALTFINLTLAARSINVLAINPGIANISVSHTAFEHHDPADRLIAATALYCKGQLVTCDSRLRKMSVESRNVVAMIY